MGSETWNVFSFIQNHAFLNKNKLHQIKLFSVISHSIYQSKYTFWEIQQFGNWLYQLQSLMTTFLINLEEILWLIKWFKLLFFTFSKLSDPWEGQSRKRASLSRNIRARRNCGRSGSLLVWLVKSENRPAPGKSARSWPRCQEPVGSFHCFKSNYTACSRVTQHPIRH